MLWHRQPGIPAPHLTSTINSTDKSPFWYCIKSNGYREKTTNYCLCFKCFKRIRTQIIKSQYVLESCHFAINSVTYHEIICSQCLTPVTQLTPTRNCFTCTDKLTLYLHYLKINEQTLEVTEETTHVISRGSFH